MEHLWLLQLQKVSVGTKKCQSTLNKVKFLIQAFDINWR